ncbi:hypothetical protein TNCV_67891 [Trichonephila clavipes]|nr:hypothetical protein TNCV_67891 [Trichonephila clavipes]
MDTISHVNIRDNEITERNRLAKEGGENEMASGTFLTYQELYSNASSKLKLIWRISPTRQCYTGTSPGSLLEIKCDRGSQTDLAGLTSGHLKCFSYDSRREIQHTCKQCCDHPASLDLSF